MIEDRQLHASQEHATVGAHPRHRQTSEAITHLRKPASAGSTKRRLHTAAIRQTGPQDEYQVDEEVDPEWAAYVAEAIAKRCYICDYANPPEATVCENCGRTLEIICPVCGNANQPDWTECFNCDSALPAAEPGVQVLAARPSETAPSTESSFLVIMLFLGGLIWLFWRISDGIPGFPLIWFEAPAVVLLLLVTFAFIRYSALGRSER